MTNTRREVKDMGQKISYEEMYKRGYQIALDRGFTPKEIAEADDQLVTALYETVEFVEGRGTLMLESVEDELGGGIEAYIYESYDDAVTRELVDNILDAPINE